MNQEYLETVDKLKKLTRNTPLMMQSDVNSFLYQEDILLYDCLRLVFALFPRYTKRYFVRIMLGWLNRKKKRYSFKNELDESCIRFLMKCNTKKVEEFVSLIKECDILRGILYAYIAGIVTDFEKYGIEDCQKLKDKYFVDTIALGILMEVEDKFEKARRLQEEVEKAFYKKVIAMAIAISNNNPNFIEDNFMEGARGLRKAIWRFNIMHGGVLAGFIDIWINNELLLFQPCNLIKVPTGMNSLHAKIQEGISKGKTFAESAKMAGMTEERAKDVEFFLTKEADIRIDVAVGNGVEDEDTKLPEELIQQFENNEKDEVIQEMLNSVDVKSKKILCMYYGIFGELQDEEVITQEEISKEAERQKL